MTGPAVSTSGLGWRFRPSLTGLTRPIICGGEWAGGGGLGVYICFCCLVCDRGFGEVTILSSGAHGKPECADAAHVYTSPRWLTFESC